MLDLEGIHDGARVRATHVAAMLHAVAREEKRGRWPARLLEPHRATWNAFRGRLDDRAFIQLLLDDAAVTHPDAFRAAHEDGESADAIAGAVATRWLDDIVRAELDVTSAEYIEAQAQRLGIPTRFARSELKQLQPHHRALELPGSGGQLAHHILTTNDRVTLSQNFVIACGSPNEVLLAGLVATELGVGGDLPVRLDPTLTITLAERTHFDLVIGPAKGDVFEKARLLELFPTARIALV